MSRPRAERSNRLSPMQFVVGFGVVSMLTDMVYEGARSITGPYLATVGHPRHWSDSSPAQGRPSRSSCGW